MGSVSFAPSGGRTPYAIQLDSVAVVGLGPFAVTVGAHGYRVLDADGCFVDATFSVQSPPLVNIKKIYYYHIEISND